MNARFEFEPRENCICGAPLDGSFESVTKHFPRGAVTFRRCRACGSWCQSPIVTEAALASWIDSEDYQGSGAKSGVAYANYAADEENRLAEAQGRYLRDIAPLLRPGSRVLEIGCATGSLLAIIRRHGHHVLGIDLSKSFAEAARAIHGLEVQVGDVLHSALPQGQFDAVLAMGTVSNFRSFGDCLARIRELLAPGGLLIFNFPDANSLWVRLLYRERFWMFTPSVMTFMTKQGCLRALEAAQYEVLRAAPDRQRPSLRKLLHHGRMGYLLPAMRALGLGEMSVPFAIPIPTVQIFVAQQKLGALQIAHRAMMR